MFPIQNKNEHPFTSYNDCQSRNILHKITEIFFLAGIPFKTERQSSTWSGWDMFITFLQFPLIIYAACSCNRYH